MDVSDARVHLPRDTHLPPRDERGIWASARRPIDWMSVGPGRRIYANRYSFCGTSTFVHTYVYIRVYIHSCGTHRYLLLVNVLRRASGGLGEEGSRRRGMRAEIRRGAYAS